MNKFYLDSLKRVGISEGGYVNDKDDTGGETYAGLSRVHNPDLKMWKIIDEIKRTSGTAGINAKLKAIPAVQEEKALVYKKRYWDPIQLDLLNSKELAHQIFDMSVNSGVSLAIKLAEELVGMKPTGKYSKELGTKLKEYGQV